MKKWIYLTVGIVVLAAGGYYGYGHFFRKELALAIPVQTARVVKGDLAVTVSGSGTVSTVSSSEVKADTEGELEPLRFKEGDTVKKGQVLAVYKAPDVGDQITQAQVSIQKQEIQFAQLKQKYIDAADDKSRGDVSYQIESFKLDMASSRASLAELQKKQTDIEKITAPIDGKVVSVGVAEEGQRIQANTVIATIVDYDNLQSVIQVDELDVAKVKSGQQGTVLLDALKDAVIEGTVTKIADEGTATNGVSLFDVTIGFKAQAGVKPGMTASAEIRVENKKDVLLVPIEAIRDRGGSKMVILANQNGTAQPQSAGQAQREDQAKGSGAGQMNSQNAGTDQTRTRSAGTGQTRPQGDDQAPSQGGYRSQFQSQTQSPGQSSERNQVRSAGQSSAQAQQRPSFAENMRQVTVGISNETYIEVLSGLSEGDEVVLPAVTVSSSSQMQAAFPGGMSGARSFGGGFGGGGFGSGQATRTQSSQSSQGSQSSQDQSGGGGRS
jgi:HlyD family secretion protein